MKNELAVIHELKMVASIFRDAGVHAHTNEMAGMVQTEIECKGTHTEIFKVFINDDDTYHAVLVRDGKVINEQTLESINRVRGALKFRIRKNQ